MFFPQLLIQTMGYNSLHLMHDLSAKGLTKTKSICKHAFECKEKEEEEQEEEEGE